MLKVKSEFGKNVLTLMTGTTLAQAIPIAISPVLTRIYTPNDFGMFALYIAIISIITVIATGKYELAIMLPKNDEDAFLIIILSLTIALIISVLVFLIIFFFHLEIINFFENQEIYNWLYLIPISILLSAVYQNLNYWNNRNKEYKTMSKVTVLQSTTGATMNIGFGLMHFSFMGMILSNITASIFSIFYLLLKNIKNIKKYKKIIKKEQIIILAKQYKQFPLHTLPQNFIYQGYIQLPILAIKSLFLLTVLGYFALAYRVIATPLSIIGNSLGQVFYQKASVMYLEDKIKLLEYVKNLFIKLLCISLFVGSILVWFLPEIFSFIFGSNWKKAGEIAQYLMIYLIFDFALTPFTKIYLISNNNIFYLKWELLRFFAMFLFCLIYYWINYIDIDLFFIGFSMINLLSYIFLAVPILNKQSFIWREN